MRKTHVEELTLDEVRTILSAKLQYELEDVTGVTREWYSSLGLVVLPFDQFINEKIAEAICIIVSEKIVFDDPSPIDDHDFEARVEAIMQEIALYENKEEMPAINFRQYLKNLFVSTLDSIAQPDGLPYLGYRIWLQSFMDLAAELDVDPVYLVVDHDVCDELLRRTNDKDEFTRNGLAEIDVMVDLEILLETVIRPVIESKTADLNLPPSEAKKKIEESLSILRIDLIPKIKIAKDIMTARFMARVERIFG